MGKVAILTILDDEEKIFKYVQKFMKKESGFHIVEPDPIAILSFKELKINLYHRQVFIGEQSRDADPNILLR